MSAIKPTRHQRAGLAGFHFELQVTQICFCSLQARQLAVHVRLTLPQPWSSVRAAQEGAGARANG